MIYNEVAPGCLFGHLLAILCLVIVMTLGTASSKHEDISIYENHELTNLMCFLFTDISAYFPAEGGSCYQASDAGDVSSLDRFQARG
jgi:hypothetical protein